MSSLLLVRRPISMAGALGRTVLLTLLPHGGQLTARRNAWGAMAVDAGRARARREAAHAVAVAEGAVSPVVTVCAGQQ
jgi:hypothetical protein